MIDESFGDDTIGKTEETSQNEDTSVNDEENEAEVKPDHQGSEESSDQKSGDSTKDTGAANEEELKEEL